MRSFDVAFVCIGDGSGKQSAYYEGLEIARIHPTLEGCYLVEFFVMGIDVEDKFVEDRETAQLVIWGAVAARMSGAMYQAVCVSKHAHVH